MHHGGSRSSPVKHSVVTSLATRIMLCVGKYFSGHRLLIWAAIAQSVQRLVTGWTVRGSNPGVGKIFRTRPDKRWGPSILLYSECRVSCPGVKRPGRGINHPPLSSVEVKERIELYLYSLSGPSSPVVG